MTTTNTLKRHAALVDRMASAQGLDLEEQILRGRMSLPDLDDAVLRCTGCTQPCACETWLDALTEAVETPPAYCRNTPLFDALKRG